MLFVRLYLDRFALSEWNRCEGASHSRRLPLRVSQKREIRSTRHSSRKPSELHPSASRPLLFNVT